MAEGRTVEGSSSAKLVRWPKILLLGDSQTQLGYGEDGCWASRLSNHFQRKCDVVNRGFSGYNSKWLKEMLPKLVDKDLAKECAAVTIFLGSNDANCGVINPRQHVSLVEYKSALKFIVNFLVELDIDKTKIILIAPPLVNEDLWGSVKRTAGDELGLFNKNLIQYAAACCEVAGEVNVDCIDLYTEMSKHQDWEKFVNVDGLHLAKEGGEFLANLLLPKLTVICESCHELFPDWKCVNFENPSSSF